MATEQPKIVDSYEGSEGTQFVTLEVPAETPAPETPDAAVEIAQIEADASVAIAETHAAVEIAAIEARSETDAENASLRERNAWLESEVTNLREQNLALTAAQEAPPSTPPNSLEEAAEELAEVAAELDPEAMTTDTLETQTETSSSTATEAPSESAVESPVEEAAEAVQAVTRKLRFL